MTRYVATALATILLASAAPAADDAKKDKEALRGA